MVIHLCHQFHGRSSSSSVTWSFIIIVSSVINHHCHFLSFIIVVSFCHSSSLSASVIPHRCQLLCHSSSLSVSLSFIIVVNFTLIHLRRQFHCHHCRQFHWHHHSQFHCHSSSSTVSLSFIIIVSPIVIHHRCQSHFHSSSLSVSFSFIVTHHRPNFRHFDHYFDCPSSLNHFDCPSLSSSVSLVYSKLSSVSLLCILVISYLVLYHRSHCHRPSSVLFWEARHFISPYAASHLSSLFSCL